MLGNDKALTNKNEISCIITLLLNAIVSEFDKRSSKASSSCNVGDKTRVVTQL